MASRKRKFYVVWEGKTPGVYDSWDACAAQIRNYSNARFKAFPTREAAAQAFGEGPGDYWGTSKFVSALSRQELAAIGPPPRAGLCVDAACDSTSGVMEYRGLWLPDRSIAFQVGPLEHGTNNIGEFLAIVHALALLARESRDSPVYTDSRTAIGWVRRKAANSKVMAEGRTSPKVNELVVRAEQWLKSHDHVNEILKWHTEAWGEIPADYGRK